jgi:hypothetical protein
MSDHAVLDWRVLRKRLLYYQTILGYCEFICFFRVENFLDVPSWLLMSGKPCDCSISSVIFWKVKMQSYILDSIHLSEDKQMDWIKKENT